MKKKKVTALITVMVMSLFGIVGCSDNTAKTSAPAATGTGAQNQSSNKPEATIDTNSIKKPVTQIAVSEDKKYTIFVDGIKGDDKNDGALATPVKTLAKAKELVKTKTAGMEKDVIVYLRGGTYTLTETLKFDSTDNGQNSHNVIWTAYKGEDVVISGGTIVSGWELNDANLNIWKAPANGIISRDFFVNGKRAIRAKGDILKGVILTEDGFSTTTLSIANLKRPGDMEVILKNMWNMPRITADKIEDKGSFVNVTLKQPGWSSYLDTAQAGGKQANYTQIQYAENAYEFLDKPGEWYLDTTDNVIYYIPAKDVNLSKANTVLGSLEQLVTLTGTEEKSVENITFTGITFSHTTWLQASKDEGLLTLQANVYKKKGVTAQTMWDNKNWIDPSNAIYGEFLMNVNFTYNTFVNIGNGAVHLGRGTKNSIISHNYVTDCAGSGITLGGFAHIDHHPVSKNGKNYDKGIKILSENNNINDNYIIKVATEYKGGTGILVGYAARTNVEYNTIMDLPYTGISFGWGWGFHEDELNGTYYTDENGKFLLCDNRICFNYIENIMNFLFDGGGIYTLGRMDGTVINGNYINKVNNDYGGIYLDQGSSGLNIRNNALLNCYRNYIYKGDYNYITDNYASEKTAQKPDLEMIKPLGEEIHYKFENNYKWNDAEIEAIKKAAGVRD